MAANLSGKVQQIQGKVNAMYKQIQGLEAEAKSNLEKSKQAKGSARQMYKNKCLMTLKKKKQLQQQVQKLNSQQHMIQQAVFNIESAQGHKQMFEGLQGAVNSQKEAMKNVNYDKMMDIQDEMIDMKMESDMMNEMLNRNYDMDIDEDEFQDEFMQFEKEVAVEKKRQAVNPAKKQEIKGNSLDDYLKM